MSETEYQVIARKYRPQTFKEVLGQDPIVTTLKNGIRKKRLAHAYLFSGSRGTGKTTLARLFAKALNCIHLNALFEPCNQCVSCKEISAGHSLDVLEIDGASHRGIDDIRQINETVGYTTFSGKYKIYIIDEVHMLTKEAFNALLKTLEEPPPNVKFLFATTEPHKVLPTIISRCQRFHLNRIPLAHILEKLQRICDDLDVAIEKEALGLIAQRAEGGLRDAESLLDQILSFHDEGEKTVTSENVAEVLGIVPQETFFWLDEAGEKGRLAAAFEITETIFSGGKDLTHFVEMLISHIRTILIIKLAEEDAKDGKRENKEKNLLEHLVFSEKERSAYLETAKKYRKEQCLDLIEYLVKVQQEIRFASSPRIALEAALLHVLRSFFRIPIEIITQRLSELEAVFKKECDIEEMIYPNNLKNRDSDLAKSSGFDLPQSTPYCNMGSIEEVESRELSLKSETDFSNCLGIKAKNGGDTLIGEVKSKILPKNGSIKCEKASHPIDKVEKTLEEGKNPNKEEPKAVPLSTPSTSPTEPSPLSLSREKQSRYDTLFQFAAIELEGKLQK